MNDPSRLFILNFIPLSHGKERYLSVMPFSGEFYFKAVRF